MRAQYILRLWVAGHITPSPFGVSQEFLRRLVWRTVTEQIQQLVGLLYAKPTYIIGLNNTLFMGRGIARQPSAVWPVNLVYWPKLACFRVVIEISCLTGLPYRPYPVLGWSTYFMPIPKKYATSDTQYRLFFKWSTIHHGQSKDHWFVQTIF